MLVLREELDAAEGGAVELIIQPKAA